MAAVHRDPHRADVKVLPGAPQGALAQPFLFSSCPHFAGSTRALVQNAGEEIASPCQLRSKNRSLAGPGKQLVGSERTRAAQPGDDGRLAVLGQDLKRKTWLRRGNIVFDLGEHAVAGLLGVVRDQPGGAAGGKKTNGAAAAVKGTVVPRLVKVAD